MHNFIVQKKTDCENYSYGTIRVYNSTEKIISVFISRHGTNTVDSDNVYPGFSCTMTGVPGGNVKVRISFDGGYTSEIKEVKLEACSESELEVE
jgi:hypothetical protein